MTGKREQNKQANRATILAAARDCFIEQSFDAISVRDIIRRTPLAAGTFYNYFPDKDSVYRALLDDRMRSLTERLTGIRRNARTLREFVHGAYSAAFETIATDPLFYEGILRNIAMVRDTFEQSVLGLSVQALENDIRDAIDRGLIPDTDVEYLAAAFFGVGFEMGRSLARRQDRDPARAADMATAMFLDGFSAPSRPQHAVA